MSSTTHTSNVLQVRIGAICCCCCELMMLIHANSFVRVVLLQAHSGVNTNKLEHESVHNTRRMIVYRCLLHCSFARATVPMPTPTLSLSLSSLTRSHLNMHDTSHLLSIPHRFPRLPCSSRVLRVLYRIAAGTKLHHVSEPTQGLSSLKQSVIQEAAAEGKGLSQHLRQYRMTIAT